MKRTRTITVRPAGNEDYENILRLARPSFGKYSLFPEKTIESMLRGRTSKVFVAERGERAAGFVIVSFEVVNQPFGPWLRPVTASLDAIAVHPEMMGEGIGRALLSEALRVAKSEHAVNMTLRTAASNQKALALFRATGFQTTLEIPQFYRGTLTAFAMTLLLDSQ